MTNIKKPTQISNLEQAENQIKQRYFTSIIARMKAEFIRLAVWLSIAWG